MRLRLSERPWLALAICIPLFFIAHRGAYEGFFSDDDFDNLGWTTIIGADVFRDGLLTPKFSYDNFRPVGHYFYRLMHALAGFDFARWVLVLQCLHLANVFLVFRLCRALGALLPGAVAASALFAVHPALFAAYWRPMYIFDLSCATLLAVATLLYLKDRWLLSLLAFWFAYKAKEVAVFFPLVLVLLEWTGGRRWLRLLPFCAISLNFGLQALLANRVRDTAYTLRFTREALTAAGGFYLGYLAIPLVPLALFKHRDRRLWLALAAFLVLMGPLWFLPARLFAVYLYVPMLALAVGIAFATEHISPRWLFAIGAAYLAFVHFVELRAFRKAELTIGRENRTFFQKACAMKDQIDPRGALLWEGNPPHLNSWGVEGVYHLCYSPALKLVRLDPDEPNWKRHADRALQWDASRQQLQLIRNEPSPRLNPFQFERGWHGFNYGVRWSSENPMARILHQPGADELQVVIHPTTTQIEKFGHIQLVVYLDGQWIGDARIDRAVPFLRSWPVAPVTEAKMRTVDFQVTPFHTVPGSPHRYGLPFADFSLRKKQP